MNFNDFHYSRSYKNVYNLGIILITHRIVMQLLLLILTDTFYKTLQISILTLVQGCELQDLIFT